MHADMSECRLCQDAVFLFLDPFLFKVFEGTSVVLNPNKIEGFVWP